MKINFSRISSILIMTVGTIVLYGWFFDIENLKRIRPQLVAMNPMTAIAFILAGLALFSNTFSYKSKKFSQATNFLAILIIFIGGLKLLEVFFKIPITIDQVFFSDKLAGDITKTPNRMAPNTAANFVFIGFAFLSINFNKIFKFKLHKLFALLTIALSSLAIAGYFYNFTVLYSITTYIPMALHTAFTFLLLSCVIYFIGSNKTVIESFNNSTLPQKFIYGFGVIGMLAILNSAYVFQSIVGLKKASEESERISQAAENALLLDLDVLRVISNLQQYSETKDKNLLKELDTNRKSAGSRRAELRKLTTNPDVLAALNGYESLQSKRQELAQAILANVDSNGNTVELAELKKERASYDLQARGYLKNIVELEGKELQDSFADAKKIRKVVIKNMAITTFAMISGILVIGILITKSINNQLKNFVNAADKIGEGDLNTKINIASKDELGKLGLTLNQMTEKLKQSYDDLSSLNAKISREKSRNEAILSSIGDGVFAVDLNGKVVLMNQVAEHLSGHKSSECIGKEYREIFKFIDTKNADSAYPDFVAKVLKTGKILTLLKHTVLVRKDGKQISVSDSAAPIKDANGKLMGCIVVFRDSSQEIALERSKDEFMSIASHQLRTPLSSMRWTMEMLKDGDYGKVTPKVQTVIKEMYDSNMRMIDLVNDLLDISRIEQGRVKDEPVSTDIVKIIEDAVGEIKPLAKQLNVIVNPICEEKIPELFIDPKRFREAMQNLLSNSVKYNVKDGKVDVIIEKIDEKVLIKIADTGLGIPKDDQSKIFTKFFRAKNVATSDTEGTGLGLYVVKSYIENWGGRIWYESPTIFSKKDGVEIELGTTFYIELPIKTEQSA